MQRRREHRYEVWESVALTVLGGQDPLCRAATVVDISRSGYRLLSGVNLAIGAEVLISLHSVAIFGTVRHCEETENESFTAGVQITRVVSEAEPLSADGAIEGSPAEVAAGDGPIDTRLRV